MVIEFIGGYLTESLALISDAMHMMTDAFALLLALIAIHAGRKVADLSSELMAMLVLKYWLLR
ncbi:cation transporter [Proteus mirabilis]